MKKKIILILVLIVLLIAGGLAFLFSPKGQQIVAERMNHITVEKKEVNGISFIEVNAYVDEPKPLVFFQHGLSGGAEDLRLQGEGLALQGYRAVLVDALEFGDNATGKMQTIPDIIAKTTAWYDDILDYYMESGKMADQKFALVGMSMGGMIEYSYLVNGKYDPVCAVALYTTPDWTISDHSEAFYSIVQNGNIVTNSVSQEQFETIHNQYLENTPSKDVNRIFRLPLLTINGDADPIMGVPDMEALLNQADQEQIVEPVQIVREGQGHFLAEGDAEEITAFLEKNLKN